MKRKRNSGVGCSAQLGGTTKEIMNKRINKPTGLRKWVRARIPRLEHFLFDVPWDRRTKLVVLILVLLLAGLIWLPVDFVAKWIRR